MDKVIVLKAVIFQWKDKKEINKEISDTVNAMQRMQTGHEEGVDALERMIKEGIPEEVTLAQDLAMELANAGPDARESLLCWKETKSQ